MRNPQATIRDIAIKLDISISTVSRALRGATDVNAETKKAVLEMAAKLNYEPNRVAQSLRIKKTNTIGVIVPEIAMHFFSSAISGIQEYAASKGYSIMICQSMENYVIEKSNIHMLVSNRVDGLIISLSCQTSDFHHLQQITDKKIPVVLFDRVCTELNVSKVVVDDYEGAHKAVTYLIKTGCKKIAHITGPENLYIARQRKKGYTDALKENNLPVDGAFIFHCKDLQKDTAEAAQKLISLHPDAIFCMNDPMAITVLQVLKQNRIKIPDEISVIGFTNEPVSAFIEPSLTTIAQPSHEIGRMAAQLLINEMDSADAFEPVTQIISTELILRDSTRPIISTQE